jgi:hypothetical protein
VFQKNIGYKLFTIICTIVVLHIIIYHYFINMPEPYILDWTKQLGTSDNDEAIGVAIDSNNNVYITGNTEGDLDGPNAGSVDAFLAKYDSAGTLVWTKQLGTSSSDQAYSVAIDSNNNVYITGSTAGSLDGPNAGEDDAFLAKYDSTGDRVWTKQLGTSSYDGTFSVAIDSNNYVYITGYTGGSLEGSNAGSYDAFLAKYDSSTGDRVWTKQLGTSSLDVAYSVAIDSNNNVYITGATGGGLDGLNAGSADAFLAKYDSTGDRVWTKQLGTSSYDEAFGVAIDSNNNVYITGYTEGALDGPNAGSSDDPFFFWATSDAFLAKYDSSTGNRVWTKQLGTSSSDQATSVAIDSNNNVYITGHTEGDLGGSNAGSFDAFLAKYDSSTGDRVWTKQLGTSSYDGAQYVAIDSNNNVYITGYTEGDLGGPNAGSGDAFLAKYIDPSPPPPAPICFPKGTPVTTNQGLVPIEKLNPDIHTIRNKRIVAITQTRPLFTHIVSIEKDALGKNVPSATTQISKEHSVFYKGKMVKANELVEVCEGVTRIPYNGETLYNVLMEKHDKMMINNLVCETLDPKNIMAKICGGKYDSSEQKKICAELTNIIKANNIPAYKKLYASLK